MKKLPKLLNTPARVVIAVGAIVLAAELFIMTMIHDAIAPLNVPDVYWNFIDTILLTLIVSPALYFMVFRKMHKSEILSELDVDKAESLAQADIVAEKIRATLAEPYVLAIQQEDKAGTITVEHHCTSSIGVVLFINHEASTEDIIKWADIAMYQAKEAGGNLIRFYDSPHYLARIHLA